MTMYKWKKEIVLNNVVRRWWYNLNDAKQQYLADKHYPHSDYIETHHNVERIKLIYKELQKTETMKDPLTKDELKFILGLPRKFKLETLKECQEKGDFAMAFELMKILLDAPISEGGIETEVISDIMEIDKQV